MTSDQAPPPADAVVVGIDGSDHDATVVAWAAGAASRSGKPLHLVHAAEEPGQVARQDSVTGLPTGIFEAENAAGLQAVLDKAREEWPDLEITGSQVFAQADRALIKASDGAYLVVVGARRVGGVERLLLGRSPLAVSMHARCPVVLVPDGARTDADGPVVVGVDGSDASARAAERAFWIAGTRGTSVRAGASWSLGVVDGMVVTTPGTPAWEATEAKYRAIAERSLTVAREAHPDVSVEVVVRRGPAPQVLAEEASQSSLLVIGSRGRGGFAGMLLGSVAHKVIETATRPVMVVRRSAED
jgi:nucleotide-binding universal stress UspA family protein